MNKISLAELLLEYLGDVFEVVVRETNVDYTFLELGFFVERIQEIADFGFKVCFADLPLMLLFSQNAILLFKLLDVIGKFVLYTSVFVGS